PRPPSRKPAIVPEPPLSTYTRWSPAIVTLFGSVPPELAVPIRRRPRGVTANAETESLPPVTFTTKVPSRETTIECPEPRAPPVPPVGQLPARATDRSLARE